MRRASNLYLPYAAWPADDRTRWEAAFKAGTDRFDDCGPAAHLAESTRLGLQDGYAKFLAFLLAHHSNLLARAPATRIDREIIEAYVRWQPASCGGITIVNYLHKLRDTLRFICPDEDWSWLLTIIKRIAAQARPKPEKHHMVTSETLYALGIELMDRAITNGNATMNMSKAHAFAYRDGLMIALLALIPLRLRTLGALRIGKHLVQSGDLWALDIPPEDIKTKRPLEYPISAELSGRIDLYLNKFRCSLRLSGQSASLPSCRSDILVQPRPSECARCQGPARSRIIQYDGEALYYGAVACRGPCSCSCHRREAKRSSSLSHSSAPLSAALRPVGATVSTTRKAHTTTSGRVRAPPAKPCKLVPILMQHHAHTRLSRGPLAAVGPPFRTLHQAGRVQRVFTHV